MNTELVRATLGLIKENLPRWNQDTFADVSYTCGTTLCFAGWALMQSGYTLDHTANFVDPHGNPVRMSDVEIIAQDKLGFTNNQAEGVFYWFPESCHEFRGRDVTQREEFEVFAKHVLAVCGLTDES